MAKEKVEYSLTSTRIQKKLASLKTAEEKEAYKHLPEHAETGIAFEGQFDFGGNLEGAVERFGEQVVYNHAKLSIGLSTGGRVRDLIEDGKSPDQVQADLDEWKPGLVTRKAKKSGRQTFIEDMAVLSPEAQMAELEKLKKELVEAAKSLKAAPPVPKA